MLTAPTRDARVEFVANQLKRVRWVSDFSYLENEGYRLEWSVEGCHRMMLLQIALRKRGTATEERGSLRTDDPKSDGAVNDFWEACVAQLSLTGDPDAVPAFERIIENWQPRG